jgi:NADH-quinone oxidoreductase subunit J
MSAVANPIQWFLGILLILSSLGVILAPKPVHASLSFLLTLLLLALLYLQLSAQFIAVMQVLVYAGAILVLFMFVIILFQDAHQQIDRFDPKCSPLLLAVSSCSLLVTWLFLGRRLLALPVASNGLPEDYGSVEAIGKALYLDYFFPFEAVILLFLIALVAVLYIGKRSK